MFGFLLSVISTDFVGVDHIGPAFGFMTMFHGVGASIGTPIGGILFLPLYMNDMNRYQQKVQFDMCALQKFKSACVFAQSDKSLRWSTKNLTRLSDFNPRCSRMPTCTLV